MEHREEEDGARKEEGTQSFRTLRATLRVWPGKLLKDIRRWVTNEHHFGREMMDTWSCAWWVETKRQKEEVKKWAGPGEGERRVKDESQPPWSNNHVDTERGRSAREPGLGGHHDCDLDVVGTGLGSGQGSDALGWGGLGRVQGKVQEGRALSGLGLPPAGGPFQAALGRRLQEAGLRGYFQVFRRRLRNVRPAAQRD